MVDTPFINDGADESLRKTVSLLNKIEAKTGSTTITGPVTVSNEVEVTNSTGNPIPVSGTVTVNDMTSGNAKTKIVDSVGADVSYITAGTAGTPSAGVLSVQGISGGVSLPISGSVETGLAQPLTDTQLRALAVPISGTVTANTGLTPLTDTQLRASSVAVSLASVPSHPVTGPLTDTQLRAAAVPVSGTVTANTGLTQPLTDTQLRAASVPVSQATAANLNATVVGSGSFTAAQATASSLKTQAQILNSAGSLITYAESGTYGNPSVDVISVQNPQGTSATIATFTSTTASSSLVAVATSRKTLTVYNSGPGDLNISPTATCTTTNFQIRLASNDYWECPDQQVTMAHTAVFSSAGTAYVTTIS